MERISIVVPIYNVAKYLDKCINTLVNQTYSDLEIILVNDGSTDESLSICNEWKEKDKRIVVVNKENGGLSSARNAGIKKANGSYICFVDSDDYVELDMVEKLINAIHEDGSDIAICNRVEFYDYKKKNQYKLSFKNDNKHLCMNKKEALAELCSFRLFDMSAWSKMYRTSFFSNMDFPEGKLSEDYYIMYILFDKCKKISYVNEPLYVYRQRKGSISKNKKINYDYKIAAEEQMNYMDDKYPDMKKYSHSAFAFSNMTICNWYITNRQSLPSREEYIGLRNNVKENLKYIYDNEKISKSRKFQAKIFVFNKYLYAICYILYKLF